MKYGQLMVGLLAGSALGLAVGSNSAASGGSGGGDREEIAEVVRDVIAKEPKLILDSVQKYQQEMQANALKGASDALKDKALSAQIFNDKNTAFIGPKDADKVVVEYFDYNCPACKAMYKTVEELKQKNKDIKVIFKEYPIFGPVSDTNSKIGLAVWKHYPDKYYDFHAKMMEHQGKADDKTAMKFVTDLGMDAQKIKSYVDSPEAEATLKENRIEGEKLMVQGTPTVIVGDEVIGHALPYDEVIKRLGASGGEAEKPVEKEKPAAEEKPTKPKKPAEKSEESSEE